MTEPPPPSGIDPFQPRPPLTWDGGAAFGAYVEAMREIQDLVGGTNPPTAALGRARELLEEVAAVLRPHRCEERDLLAGRRYDLPGRGHPFLPGVVYIESTADFLRGSVRFTQFHLGGNGAAHGGALPLLFDEVLGHLCNSDGRSIARTAYLHVNYRAITPIGVDLVIEAAIEREEGRKRFITGRLLRGATVLSDAEGLFVQLLPGQP